MLVTWKEGEAQITLPSRERVTPLAITGGEAAVRPTSPAGAITQRGRGEVT